MVVFTGEGGILIGNGVLFVIHELRHQGLSISAIARQTGRSQPGRRVLASHAPAAAGLSNRGAERHFITPIRLPDPRRTETRQAHRCCLEHDRDGIIRPPEATMEPNR